MPRRYVIVFLILILALVPLACNFPTRYDRAAKLTLTPGSQTPGGPTEPSLVTTTPGAAQTPVATQAAAEDNNSSCTYKVTFIDDVTVPDDTIVAPGKSFTKTWRVRNDGTCTWGPGHALSALAFTGGSRLGAPASLALQSTAGPGDTIDVSVNLTAPQAAGTYISQWEFLIQSGASTGKYVGVGSDGSGPLYARIKVGQGNQASVIRLSFDAGATSTAISDVLQPNEVRQYVLAAQQNQILEATLSSSTSDTKVAISASDNTALTGSNNGTFAMAVLPSTQDYIVTVTNGGQKANFALNITIPSRITFPAGSTEVSIDGAVSHHFNVTYVLRAAAGQTMSVVLTGSNVGLTIYGLEDGQPLIRAASGATSFNQKLPRTQDYIIDVVPAVDSTTFTMKISIQ